TLSLPLTLPPTPTTHPLSLHDALPIYYLTRNGVDHDSSEAAPPQASRSPSSFASRLSANTPCYQFCPLTCHWRLWEIGRRGATRSEEHTSELQSANISYAVFCLKKKTT